MQYSTVQVQGQILPSTYKFPNPAYAHTSSCQKVYHPRTVESIGLTDGESLERLWSYLGKFVNITKYMKSNHRLDILEMALEYAYQKLIKKYKNH